MPPLTPKEEEKLRTLYDNVMSGHDKIYRELDIIRSHCEDVYDNIVEILYLTSTVLDKDNARQRSTPKEETQ